MRKNAALLVLLFLGVGITACQQKQETDPELKAAIIAMSAKSQESKATDNSDITSEIRNMRSSLEAELSSVKRNVNDVSGELVKVKAGVETNAKVVDTLGSVKENAEANAVAIKSNHDAAMKKFDAIQKLLTAVDMNGFSEDMRTLSDLTAENIRIKGQLAEREEELKKAQAANKNKDEEIKNLENDLASASGGDVSNHPRVRELEREKAALQKANQKLQDDYEAMKRVVDQHAETIERLKGSNPVNNGDSDPKKAAPSFVYKISSTQFHADTRQWIVLANMLSGKAPSKNSEALIVDEDDNVICRVSITQVYAADPAKGAKAQIGGETINASTTNAPLKGYRIIPARSISAEGR